MLSFLLIFLTCFAILIAINFLLINSKFLLHDSSLSDHKFVGAKRIPISGGIFFYLIVIYLFFSEQLKLFDLTAYLLTFGIFFYIGIMSDIGKEINAKTRLIIQAITLIIFLSFLNIIILKTNIDPLDVLLENKIFTLIFTIFCILILINGLNFIDGVNLNSSGYLLASYIILYLLDQHILNDNYFKNQYLKVIIFSLLAFYILNFIEKNFLGDSGIYILGLLLGLDIINYCNFNNTVSPIVAINFLWYPAFENLFSIIRKLFSKKDPLKPDKKHLHTLVYSYLVLKKFRYPNTLAGLIINSILVPCFVSVLYFYNSSYKLSFVVLIYIIIYISLYLFINSKLKNE